MGNGTYTTYSYDRDGDLLDLVNYAPGGSVSSSFIYTYNDVGLETGQTTLQGQWIYTYDPDGELTHAVFVSNNPSTVPNQDLQYFYDGDGNRTETVINGVTTIYTVNNMDQSTQVGSTIYGYDADGNMISATTNGVTTTYTYDDVNRLTNVSSPGDTETFGYDALGNLSSTASNGYVTQYLVDPTGIGSVVAAYDAGGNLLADYVQGLGLTSQVSSSGAQYYYDFDGLGSTVGITNHLGSEVDSYSYLPFGEFLTQNVSISNPFNFVGDLGVVSVRNALEFMRARFYAANLGLFTSQDPLGTGGGDTNGYSYVEDDPVNYVDAAGLERSKPGDDGQPSNGSGSGIFGLNPLQQAVNNLYKLGLDNLKKLRENSDNQFLNNVLDDLIQFLDNALDSPKDNTKKLFSPTGASLVDPSLIARILPRLSVIPVDQ
jgi:RHS repeat-associated protein